MALEGQWHVKVLACSDFYKAARYAADKDWWLHAWDWLETIDENVIEYTREGHDGPEKRT